jgi:hypothetical protein
VAAGIALLNVPAECRRAAALDRGHDATLPATERVRVVPTIVRPDLAKDIRHLEPGGTHRRLRSVPVGSVARVQAVA